MHTEHHIILDELPMDLDFTLHHAVDESGHVRLASDPSAMPEWEVVIHYAGHEERSLRILGRELRLLGEEIDRYLSGNLGGPTPETLAHAHAPVCATPRCGHLHTQHRYMDDRCLVGGCACAGWTDKVSPDEREVEGE